MEFFNDHKKLFRAVFGFFLALSLFVAILPALDNQKNNAPLPHAVPLGEDAVKGKALFIANGCVACHTQQVRNLEMDKVWGPRPGIAADYAGIHRTDFWRNTATLMGSERTGPDLTNIGLRQPGYSWHLTHLFNPRILVKESIMPAYPWLFTIKEKQDKGDIVAPVPPEFMEGGTGKAVATPEALQLVAYLVSLKQVDLPDGRPVPDFLYKRPLASSSGSGSSGSAASNGSPGGAALPDGAELYAIYCRGCHQPDGKGLQGAYPPLKDSKVVLDDNPEPMVDIILNGYTGRIREGFGPMPAVGTINDLSPEQVAAIMNHEKSSLGNQAKQVDLATIKKFIDGIKTKK
jgi:cytochrome c oxidase cbb3-type subunit 2